MCINIKTNAKGKPIKLVIQNLSSISNSTYIANGAHGKVLKRKLENIMLVKIFKSIVFEEIKNFK